jgi:hypothetical protein
VKIGLQMDDAQRSEAGLPVFSTIQARDWSAFAGDTNYYDADCMKVFLAVDGVKR